MDDNKMVTNVFVQWNNGIMKMVYEFVVDNDSETRDENVCTSQLPFH